MTNKITLFHASWCGHCKNFLPEWEKLQELSKSLQIETVDYEVTNNKEIMQKAGIKGYPTIRITNNNNEYDYHGERTATDILKEFTDQSAGGNLEYKYKKYKSKYLELKSLLQDRF